MKIDVEKSQLESDHTKRPDLVFLAQANLKEAQDQK